MSEWSGISRFITFECMNTWKLAIRRHFVYLSEQMPHFTAHAFNIRMGDEEQANKHGGPCEEWVPLYIVLTKSWLRVRPILELHRGYFT
jgi:hypothetical protein